MPTIEVKVGKVWRRASAIINLAGNAVVKLPPLYGFKVFKRGHWRRIRKGAAK